MGIGDVGKVPLQAPIDLSNVSNTQIDQAAQQIDQAGSPFTKDQIAGALLYLKNQGVDLSQNAVARLMAGEPVIPPPNPEAANAMKDVSGTMGLNSWLKPNPIATLSVLMLELAFVLSQTKLEEGQRAADYIVKSFDLAKEISQFIKDIGQKEYEMALASGISTIVGGALSIGFAGVALKKGGPNSHAITQIGQGLSQIASGSGEVAKGTIGLQKSNLEAQKNLTEQMKQQTEQLMQKASEEYKNMGDLINQVLQNLQKIVDEAYRAHGFQVH